MKKINKWSVSFRLWHWINTLVVLGLLGTVFLRNTFLSWRANSQILSEKLTDINIDITKQQAKVLAKAIRSPMWDWHILLGYALGALVLWRITLFFTQSGRHKYQNFKSKSMHKKAVTLGYILIYTILAFMAISGYVIHFYQDLGISKSLAHDIKEMHEFLYTGILIFVPLHIIGILIAENSNEKGIISDMINGGKA